MNIWHNILAYSGSN